MKKLLAVLLAGITLLSFAGCSADTTGKMEKIKKENAITIFMDTNFPPFEFLGSDKEAAGVDVEIGKAIAKALDVEPIFKQADFDSIIMAIASGKGDIAISGMTIREDRLKKVDFSIPYFKSVQYFILAEDSDIKIFDDLADKSVGYATGYSGQFALDDEVDKKTGVLYGKNVEKKHYASAMEGGLDVANGRIDAMIMDELVAKSIVEKNNGLKAIEVKYADGSLVEEEYGVAIPKENPDLVELINSVITELKDDDNNQIDQWVVKFGEEYIGTKD